MATDINAVAKPGGNFGIVSLIHIACLAAVRFSTEKSLMILLQGDSSGGMSHFGTRLKPNK